MTPGLEVETPVKRPRHKIAKRTRTVRFTFMERLSVECMNDIDATDLRDEVRSIILKKVITAKTLIYGAGVEHRNFCSRNIMILGSEYDSPDIPLGDIQVEVRVIDFSIAAVVTHPRYADRAFLGALKQCKKDWPLKLRSPILMRFGRMMDFPTEYWCSNEDIGAEEWLWDNFRNDDRYVPKLPSDRCNTGGDADDERDSGSSGGDEGSDSSEERNKDKEHDAGSVSSEQEQDGEATKV